jgi:DNA-binding transcriptional MocR family regulator
MTIWTPRLADTPAPIYSRIAEALERDVRSGVLVGGSRLPTHRELARSLRITPVTVTRAYAEAMRRGLVESTTGRGTFVRTANRRESIAFTETDLATNVITVPLPSPSRTLLERMGEELVTSSYSAGAGSERHRAAGAAWIAATSGRTTGHAPDPARVLVTAGTQHALFLAFAATTRPGDAVFTEALTYHGAKSMASLLGVRLVPLPLDRYGIVPDALARACRARSAPKVLYTMPSLHNPTGLVMPETRRRELAAVAEKHGLTIIEDDVCGFLLEKTPRPIAAFAPDRTIFLTGLGKALAPAMRIGFFTGPDAVVARAQAALATTILFTSPLLAELAATWIEDGTAARITAQKRAEVQLRNRAARRILPHASGDARSAHLWVELPKRWSNETFVEEARRRRVRVAGAGSFAVGDKVPRAIRVSIGAPATLAELEHALHAIAAIGETQREDPVI